jgi:hypothetical protein
MYSAGDLGVLDVASQDGRLSAHYRFGGNCALRSDLEVLTGSIEGGVFVGTVVLCQEGPSCAGQRSYPFLGVVREKSLAGVVKIDAGCMSPALVGRHLLLRPATTTEIDEARKAGPRPTPSGAAKEDASLRIKAALEEGQTKFQQGDYRAAREQFRLVLAYDDANWVALFGLGVAQTKLKDPSGAIENLAHAIGIAQKLRIDGKLLAQMHYNVACAQSQLGRRKDALSSLRQAVRQGGGVQFLDDMESDPDLTPIRQDPEFRRMLAEARGAREKGKKAR